MFDAYHELCAANNAEPNDGSFLAFVTEMNAIAARLIKPVTPRAEQLALMFLFVTSPSKINLAQLPTGTGKSMMLGLLAKYYHQQGRKVAVVVPNQVLAATQQDLYSPWASKAQDDLFDATACSINYCTYGDFLTANIPLSTVCLVDEIDALFFNDVPKLEGTKFVSAILLLNEYQTFAMSATFRGEQGTKWLARFMKGSNII